MNDPDKRIAELKGLKIEIMQGDSSGVTEIWLGIAPGSNACEPTEPWSRSDAKALELVDELIEGHPGTGINITRERQTGRWMVAICPGDWVHGEAATRPEAICRAYIAAREWMATKAGA